jgi:hypothetical protein
MSGENGSGTGKVNDAEWKSKPPYSIHSDDDGFDALYEAHCHCGRVRYQLNRKEPLSSKYCHCSTCQTQHGKYTPFPAPLSQTRGHSTDDAGAPFQWAAIFEKTDINFSHGHHNLEWYDPGSKSIAHKLPCKVRCSFCHSPIMDEGRNMILLFPTLIDFKSEAEKRRFAATYVLDAFPFFFFFLLSLSFKRF